MKKICILHEQKNVFKKIKKNFFVSSGATEQNKSAHQFFFWTKIPTSN